MALNKQGGNMYNFVTHTWGVISGRCKHGCSYCYNLGKPYFEGELRLIEKNFKENLGEGNFIFVCSSNDLFQDAIPDDWIRKVLEHCKKYPKNTYLFQSKNPKRFVKFRDKLLELQCILGTTMETNRQNILNEISNAPSIGERSDNMTIKGFRKMITIEPIMDFDVIPLISEIKRTNPEFVNIGADSKGHNLPEPSEFKIEQLIKELRKFTKVNLKDNLKRIYQSR